MIYIIFRLIYIWNMSKIAKSMLQKTQIKVNTKEKYTENSKIGKYHSFGGFDHPWESGPCKSGAVDPRICHSCVQPRPWRIWWWNQGQSERKTWNHWSSECWCWLHLRRSTPRSHSQRRQWRHLPWPPQSTTGGKSGSALVNNWNLRGKWIENPNPRTNNWSKLGRIWELENWEITEKSWRRIN